MKQLQLMLGEGRYKTVARGEMLYLRFLKVQSKLQLELGQKKESAQSLVEMQKIVRNAYPRGSCAALLCEAYIAVQALQYYNNEAIEVGLDTTYKFQQIA